MIRQMVMMIRVVERLNDVNDDGDSDPSPHLTRLSLSGRVMYALRLDGPLPDIQLIMTSPAHPLYHSVRKLLEQSHSALNS